MKKLILFVFTTLTFAACKTSPAPGNADPGGQEGECASGETRCNGDVVQHCENRSWRDWDDCAAVGEQCAVQEGESVCVDRDDDDTAADADSDADSDADIDADTDADTDADIDTETDADPVPETVFIQDAILEYHITMSDEDYVQLEEHGDEEVYLPASAHIFGGEIDETYDIIGFRHKGAWSLHHCFETGSRSFEDECAKLSYKIKFDKFDDAARFHGYKRINLHAMAVDATKLRERLAYDMFNTFGVIAPQTAYAKVFINEALMGLFVQVEQIDGRFTAFHFPHDKDGNLYKEKWPKPGLGDEHYLGGLRTNDNPEDNPDVSDMHAFGEAIDACTEETFVDEMAAWVDLDNILRYMAVDRAAKNWDGIVTFYHWTTPHNFYWYHEALPGGIFQLIPWDLDNTFWDYDPYMHPEGVLDTEPIPDWNVLPLSCDPIPVWEPDSETAAVPSGCDKFINLLAATSWETFVTIGNELLEGPLAYDVMTEKTAAWAAEIDDAVAEDPFIDYDSWLEEVTLFDDILQLAIDDFTYHLTEGYIVEEEIPEPDPEDFLTEIPEAGLVVGIVNNYEFTGGVAGTTPVDIDISLSETTTASAIWNTTDPITGDADLRFDFEFTRLEGAWDEWTNVYLYTDGVEDVDLTGYNQISITMRADIPRSVRVRVLSPVYDEELGGVWSEFGVDLTVDDTANVFKISLDELYYPDWAKEEWGTDAGWTTPDDVARDQVLARFTGLLIGPSPTTDDTGEMIDEIETGFLQIDDIYFQ